MKQFKAQKTEYKKHVFDSKSEAILAASWDLSNERNFDKKVIWRPHPNIFELGDYLPDFFVHYINAESGISVSALVEYKPKPPTQTYIEKYADYFKKVKIIDRFSLVDCFWIISGNAYDTLPGLCTAIYVGENYNIVVDSEESADHPLFNKELLIEAKGLRYDLKNY